jgi:hypothetical protein
MRVLRLPVLGAGLWCAAIALAGCAARGDSASYASTSGALPQTQREASASARAEVYVTQSNGSANGIVFGYGARNKRNNVPQCTLTGQKFDHTQIAADAAGNIYSPNLETSEINVYAPNCGALLASVKDPYGADVDVALGTGGKFYTAGNTHVSACTMSGCTSELTDPSISQLETVAADAHGNVWAAYYNKGGVPSLIVWPGGSMPGKPVSGYVNQNTPGDIQFDKHDTLVSLQSLFTHVYIYHCDVAAATCTNTKTISLHGGSLFGALNAKNTNFQATDYEGDAVDVYAYPSFKYEYSYSRGLLSGSSAQGIAEAP